MQPTPTSTTDESRPDPMFGFNQTLDYSGKTYNIAELAEADVQRQYGEMLGPSEDEIKANFQQIMSATSAADLNQAGVDVKIGDTYITPEYLNSIRGTSKEATLFADYKRTQERTQVGEFQTAVPFSGPEYKEVVLPQELRDLPDEVVEPVVNAIKNRQNLASLFKNENSPLNYLGRELIINSYKTGDLAKEAGQAFRNIPADAARLPTFVAMATNAAYAAVDAYELPGSQNGMDTSYNERFSQTFNEGMQGWASVIRGYEGTLNKSTILDSATSTMNRWYKKSFIAEYGQELWEAAHMQPTYTLINPGDERYDEDIAVQENGVGKAYVDVALDDDGKIVMKEDGLSPELVSDMIDLAYNELAGSEKAMVFAASQLPLTLGLTSRAVRRGNQMAREVNAARSDSPSKWVGKTDWEVYKGIGQENAESGTNILRNRFTQFVLGVGTLGVFGFKGKSAMHRGTMMNQHLESLQKFDDQIATYNKSILSDKKIINDAASTPDQVAAATARVEKTQDNLKAVKGSATAYKLKSGGTKGLFSSFNNPYVRSNLADDLIISAAVGYTPQVLSWDKIGMDEDTAQTLTMFTTPIAAPVLARGSLFGISSVVRRFTSGVTSDIASTMQHSSFIPYVTTAIISRGDENELRRVMAEADIPVTDDNVKAFQTLSQVYKSMKPEYQIRMTQSLERYNSMMNNAEATMRNLRGKDGSLILSDDEISANMDTLHLSLAHATGIAPLIAVQARNGRSLSAEDLRDAGKFDSLMASLAAEEANYKGLDTLMTTLQKSLVEKAGIDIDSNAPLQNMLVELQNLSIVGMEKLNVKKQEADKLVTAYVNELGEVDEDTLERIVKFRSILTDADIRDPVAQAALTAQTAVEILENGRLEAVALERFRNTLDSSEVLKNANILADKIFDISHGVRRSEVTRGYNDVRLYAQENDITVDLSSVAETLVNKTDEYAGKPFLNFMAGAETFFNTSAGRQAKKSFESAAQRGLRRDFGDDLPYVFDLARMADPSIKNHTDLALYLLKEADEAKRPEVNYFMATVEETEYVYRAFRDHQATAKNQLVSDLDGSFKEAVDEAYAASDSSGQLLRLAKQARENHETLIGEPTDSGRYAGQVLRGRKRRNVKSADPEEGRHFYPIPEDKPIAPFETIARLARQAVEETDDTARDVIIKKIETEKNRIMYWYGAGYMNDGATKGYGFDLADAKQRAVADTMQSLLQTLIGREVADSAQTMLNRALDTTTPVGLSGIGPVSKAEAITRLRKDQDYDFDRASKILQVEQAISVVTRNGPDGELTTRHLALNDVRDWSVTIDDLLEHDDVTRQIYRDTQDKLNNNASTIRTMAQQDVDKMSQTLKVMSNYENLVNDPLSFFNTVFEEATPDSINRHVQRFVNQGMDETEVRSAMAYMYMRGLEVKAGKKTEIVANNPTQVLGDASVLIHYVNTPRHQKVMKAVLGEEHFEQVKGMATWSDFAIGNGMGFRANPALAGMSVESVFSRVFNLARGMVSPIYVATEVSVRTMMQRNQSLISLALSDRVAARIMDKMLNRPKEITRKDLQLFGLRIQNYIASDIIRNGGEVPTLEQILGQEAAKGQSEIVEEEDARIEAERQKQIQAFSPAETI
tara:strand:+ start:444 stop:5297 length:4854 start_codon:yes stop_codon:yes gene_type:complete